MYILHPHKNICLERYYDCLLYTSIAEVDYGLDRYKDVGNLDFDFDESIEWSVDDDV